MIRGEVIEAKRTGFDQLLTWAAVTDLVVLAIEN